MYVCMRVGRNSYDMRLMKNNLALLFPEPRKSFIALHLVGLVVSSALPWNTIVVMFCGIRPRICDVCVATGLR